MSTMDPRIQNQYLQKARPPSPTGFRKRQGIRSDRPLHFHNTPRKPEGWRKRSETMTLATTSYKSESDLCLSNEYLHAHGPWDGNWSRLEFIGKMRFSLSRFSGLYLLFVALGLAPIPQDMRSAILHLLLVQGYLFPA